MTLNFNPQKGLEQVGHRPAIVISPKIYNHATGLVIVCPITSKIKGYSFEVALPDTLSIKGVILADQIKSMDIVARNVILEEAFSEKIELESVILECLAKIKTLVL
ncbi:type II toxin-antitoxin system PemK/MazF family toxin [Sporosarcina sp. FA9]|uniref:type II toxin-antitoxin system PemK/MazF family toxin n=1 Tax=Sporosarcina sp. FA9 TaxID=3413030 RepID=UPI003F659EC3